MGTRFFPYIGDQLLGYVIADKDDDATPNYYGYVRADGSFYIMEEVVLAGADTYKYYKGDPGNYEAAWAGRALLSYDYYHKVF